MSTSLSCLRHCMCTQYPSSIDALRDKPCMQWENRANSETKMLLCFLTPCALLFAVFYYLYIWSSPRSRNYILKTIALDWITVFLKDPNKESYSWKSTCTACIIHWFIIKVHSWSWKLEIGNQTQIARDSKPAAIVLVWRERRWKQSLELMLRPVMCLFFSLLMIFINFIGFAIL